MVQGDVAQSRGILHHQGVILAMGGGHEVKAHLLVVESSACEGLAGEFAHVVVRRLNSVLLLEKLHLLLPRLLLCLVLIFAKLHLFLKFFQKLLDCWLFCSS